MRGIEFSISLLFFWIKGKVEVDNRFVKTNLPNTILGFIPAGNDQQNIPLKNISGSLLSTKYNIKLILLGLFIFFTGFDFLKFIFIPSLILLILPGLILLVLGIGILGSGIQTILNIEKSGAPYMISVPFFEKQKMQLLNNIIHNALADDTDKTDLNLYFDKKPQSY